MLGQPQQLDTRRIRRVVLNRIGGKRGVILVHRHHRCRADIAVTGVLLLDSQSELLVAVASSLDRYREGRGRTDHIDLLSLYGSLTVICTAYRHRNVVTVSAYQTAHIERHRLRIRGCNIIRPIGAVRDIHRIGVSCIPVPRSVAVVLAQTETACGFIFRYLPDISFRSRRGCSKKRSGCRRCTCRTYIIRRRAGSSVAIDDAQFVRVSDERKLALFLIHVVRTVVLEVRAVVLQFQSIDLRTVFIRHLVPRRIRPGRSAIRSCRRDGLERDGRNQLIAHIDLIALCVIVVRLGEIRDLLRAGGVFVETAGEVTVLTSHGLRQVLHLDRVMGDRV